VDRYDAAHDHYCHPGTSVLRNKLGITSLERLEEAEHDVTAITHASIEFSPPPYNLQSLKNLHQQLFSALYEWAGAIRTVDISKGGTRFCTSSRIEAEARSRFQAMERDAWLRDLPHEVFCEKLAEHYCELNMIHPFREGNGRVQRILFEHLALNAGYRLNWALVEEREWLDANIAGVKLNYEVMTAIFKRVAVALAPF
jgi:cell filamentation protein